MHLLHLLRHAKSSWREDVEDHARPLSKRGREAARRVGRDLPNAVPRIDLVLCSSALRTRQTLDLVLAALGPAPRCLVEDGLYLADCERLIERLRQLDEACGSVMLIGHNPGLHDLAVALADSRLGRVPPPFTAKFPTAARASFAIDAPWSELGRVRHRVIGYATPSSLCED